MAHQAVEEVEPGECQQTQPPQALEETSKQMAAWAFARQVLAELGDSVLSNLCESDCPCDPTERALETDSLPWLMAEVEKTLAEKALGRTELGGKSPNLEMWGLSSRGSAELVQREASPRAACTKTEVFVEGRLKRAGLSAPHPEYRLPS
ncbi:PREDICTED: radial spoke head protein 3 homolog [Pygoscelis adeliae]|uniref:radial spoke head protein 3 homolog n=1 Tax=Pygoscelis adeliae TaxID=9238 RepID=UPI0004F4D7B7|nr:PREDICTED: radial spoke head protein 3 homolog [Pygoscelis adeliae]